VEQAEAGDDSVDQVESADEVEDPAPDSAQEVAAQPGDDVDAPESSAAETEKGEADELGESRYARKGRRLPRIEDGDSDSESSASGLRNAIISGNKRRRST
jgi:hypothetical protein